LELVVLGIAVTAVCSNFLLGQHAQASSDDSVLFSFIRNSSKTNPVLLAQNSNTAQANDQLVNEALAQSPLSITLASTQPLVTKSKIVTASTIQDGVVVKTNPADTQNLGRHGVTTYTIEPGDTLSGVAASFGISPQTIMMENKIDESTKLKVGSEINILPTTGITYTLKSGDTMDSLLKKYKINEEDFLDANNIESFDDLDVGATVVIPLDNVTMPSKPKPASNFVKNDSGQVALKQAKAPGDLEISPVSFMWPTPVRTITQGFSSRHTGIDISDSKKELIYAAADGFVEISGYQTNGYGNTIVINHGNGFKTRYGHASELYVSAGDYVKQGQLIAKQGNTGRVRGATGIHLHFEIIKNGTRVNPLAYVKP
jgi:murein DD-endopeptidase MepM/ murein hydrolase activator NlpD